MKSIDDFSNTAKKTEAEARAESPEHADGDTDDPHPTEPGPLRLPSLALRHDGALLLSTLDLTPEAREGREVWEGIVLSEAEASDLRDALDNSIIAEASLAVGSLNNRALKRACEEKPS
jgi:hypothetical protein